MFIRMAGIAERDQVNFGVISALASRCPVVYLQVQSRHPPMKLTEPPGKHEA